MGDHFIAVRGRPAADARFAGDGVLGSLMAGFGWQAGESWLLGLEGEVGLADMGWDTETAILGTTQDFGLDLDWFASASLRAGWLVEPATLLYLIGGYSHAGMKAEFTLAVAASRVPTATGRASTAGMPAPASRRC